MFKTCMAIIFILTLAFSSAMAAQLSPVWVNAEVKRIEKQSNTVLLKHEAIPHVGMSAMTMPFKVQDAALLQSLKTGDKIQFVVIQQDQDLVITQIKMR